VGATSWPKYAIEENKIEANYRNGVLEVNVPKGEQAKGKRITIKTT